jgi:hypothetical protein
MPSEVIYRGRAVLHLSSRQADFFKLNFGGVAFPKRLLLGPEK